MPSDTLPTAYPLQWPVGWKRTLANQRAPGMFAFRSETSGLGNYRGLKDITVAQACARLIAELKRMRVNEPDIIISSNLALRQDGLPRSDQGQPGDPGVAVYWVEPFNKGRARRCMAIDTYFRVAQNIAALAATVEALRAIERHGGAVIMDRAFTGFTALPAPIIVGTRRPWREVLGILNGFQAKPQDVEGQYRLLARAFHPDRGGSTDKMAELNAARDEALQELARG